MADTLKEILLDSTRRPAVVSDFEGLVDAEVSDKGGVSGAVVKTGFAAPSAGIGATPASDDAAPPSAWAAARRSAIVAATSASAMRPPCRPRRAGRTFIAT